MGTWSLTGPGDLPLWPLVKAKAVVPLQTEKGDLASVSFLRLLGGGMPTQPSWGRTPIPALQMMELRLTKVVRIGIGAGHSKFPTVLHTVGI